MIQRVIQILLLILITLSISDYKSAHCNEWNYFSNPPTLTITKDSLASNNPSKPSIDLNDDYFKKHKNIAFKLINIHDSTKNILTLKPRSWESLRKEILLPSLNAGYPFASISIQHLVPHQDTLYIYYLLEQGSYETIDTILITGDLQIEPDFLYKLISIKPGSPFHYSKIQNLDTKISQLPFARLKEAPNFRFTIGKNEWNLPIDKEKSNTIDGILGIQSNEQAQNGIKITADIQLHLWNILQFAEEFFLSYKNLEANSPHLNISAHLPFLAGLDFGPEINFDLAIKDSSYQKTRLIAGARYYLSYLNYIRLAYYQETSDIIVADLHNFHPFNQLPEINNYQSKGILIGGNINHTDHYWQPKKGWKLKGDIILYNRKLIPHQSYIEEAEKTGIMIHDWYEEANAKKYIWSGAMHIEHYIPIIPLLTLHSKLNVAHQQSSYLTKNELYRIGGSQGLRGFDELRFPTSSYGIFTLEPRIYINQETYFFLFSDLGLIKTYPSTTPPHIYAWGIGAGLNLHSKTGIFNIAFGIGKEFPHSFEVKKTQVHINYKAIF